ncbi:recombinase family protein [Bradyrhizobium neotropicale]|uniref:recombinase family protein n=1 Tax=Bradyrhizobium neotropicale TaxID=1497615 RepID=UPI001FD94117|nr:recombinase family protein [Bradyrhizobium neotropicale]
MALCRAYAARHQLDVVAIFEDKARSGASVFGRDGLMQLMDAARQHRFTVRAEAGAVARRGGTGCPRGDPYPHLTASGNAGPVHRDRQCACRHDSKPRKRGGRPRPVGRRLVHCVIVHPKGPWEGFEVEVKGKPAALVGGGLFPEGHHNGGSWLPSGFNPCGAKHPIKRRHTPFTLRLQGSPNRARQARDRRADRDGRSGSALRARHRPESPVSGTARR